ncbi:hypothetical protein B0H67DRAFT_124178 [Lasiosphaeris hirsuta]|uniref:Uncharacterized protein n=1 Tax=Lasiosphaeris hirsuta TaxID=260670 RepID=A0AA40B031_9PEZI|nr:hypothetical protein B0H67DRAFT_124178 [Lasiosphaeris hirsuta]
MSWLGRSTQIVGTCRGCLLQGSPTISVGRAVGISRQSFRHATTAAKPRARKATTPANEDLASVPKKTLSTKSPTTSSTKSPRKKKADVTAAEPEVVLVFDAAGKKRPRASTTETPPDIHPYQPINTGRFDASTVAEAPAEALAQPPAQVPAQAPAPSLAPSPATPEVEKPRKPIDVKSPEFKAASRKYTALMVALPILVVTSYYLFDRLVLGNEPEDLESFRQRAVLPEAEVEAEAKPLK